MLYLDCGIKYLAPSNRLKYKSPWKKACYDETQILPGFSPLCTCNSKGMALASGDWEVFHCLSVIRLVSLHPFCGELPPTLQVLDIIAFKKTFLMTYFQDPTSSCNFLRFSVTALDILYYSYSPVFPFLWDMKDWAVMIPWCPGHCLVCEGLDRGLDSEAYTDLFGDCSWKCGFLGQAKDQDLNIFLSPHCSSW